MKTHIPRIRKRLGNGRVLVAFPDGYRSVMRIDDFYFRYSHTFR